MGTAVGYLLTVFFHFLQRHQKTLCLDPQRHICRPYCLNPLAGKVLNQICLVKETKDGQKALLIQEESNFWL